MKKLLLSLASALLCGCAAMAQNYTAQAYTYEDESWASSYDGNIMLDEPVTVEVYDGYVIVRGWMGNADYDIKVAFDADSQEVTSLSFINGGAEGASYSSGYAANSTGNEDYYYVQLYLASGYDYANADEDGGYVTLSGYFYPDSQNYKYLYYNISWGEGGYEFLYSTDAACGNYDEWDAEGEAPFFVGKQATIDVYDGVVVINNWSAEDYSLQVYFDENAAVTDLIAYEGDEEVDLADGWLSTLTGDESLYYVSFCVADEYAYAYADEEGGYVLLWGYGYTSETEYDQGYYYIEWENNGAGVLVVSNEFRPAEFFNINGMRIANPVPGQLTIMRQGDKLTKFIAR